MSKESNISVRVGEVDLHQFVGCYFDLPVSVVSDKGDLTVHSAGIQLTVQLKFEDGTSADPSALTVDPRTLTLMKGHQTTLRVMINVLSAKCDNKHFKLHVSAAVPGHRYVTPGISTPIHCVLYMLKVVSKLNEIWYKDEGGRDKCMDLMVQLVNCSGHLVTDRRVPLRLVLKYGGGAVVAQQELFKISPDSKRVIEESGSATIKFRIDDVSKNHQKQPFAVMIAPDTVAFPQNADIGFAVSSCVDIKSKRNKRKLEESDDSVGPGSHLPQARFRGDAADGALPIGMGTHGAHHGHNPANNIYAWVQYALNNLDNMSWKRVGFERRVDGAEDRTKPLYAMTNPNATIDRIKVQFHEMQIENSLLTLSRLYDESNSSRRPNTASTSEASVAPLSIGGRSVSSLLGADQLAGIKGVSSPIPPVPTLTRNSSSTAGSSLADLPAMPERQPSMWRQQSLDYFGSCVETMMMLDKQLEVDVTSIWSVDYKSKLTGKNLGMPAYNSKKELVGFYKYKDGGNVLFCSVEEESVELGGEDYQSLRISNGENDESICHIESTNDYFKDLDRLKENALKRLWMSTA